MEVAGHRAGEKWGITAEELIITQVGLIEAASRCQPAPAAEAPR
jgi:hypothetical protein